MTDSKLADAVRIASEHRNLARTFRTSVGVAIETYDGKIFGGMNIETYGHKGYHAEEVALIRALAEGYNGVDFKRVVVVFQDAGHDEVEAFPACPSCWFWFYEFTHPDFEIISADLNGNVHYRALLKEIIHPPSPGLVFPSGKIRQIKPRLNGEPRSLRKPLA